MSEYNSAPHCKIKHAANELQPLHLPLAGRHLIEASAGTGKTFNITRLYVRLLLEKAYSVQQILVMTFTDAATEEIRTRVAEFIEEMLAKWDSNDPFVLALQQRCDKERSRQLLQSAKMSIDDAAIFTIHGFCQRVITQFSVSIKQDPESKIIPQTESLVMQAVSDSIIAFDKAARDFAFLQQYNWHTPKQFYRAFTSLIHYPSAILLITAEHIWKDYVSTINQHWQAHEPLRNRLIKQIAGSNNWLQGLAINNKNAEKIADEQDSAIAFLQQQQVLSEEQSRAIFSQLTEADYGINPLSQLLDDGLTKLFSTARAKKYPEQWFGAIKQDFEILISAIKEPLHGQSKRRIDKRMQLSLAHSVALNLIQGVQNKVSKQMQQQSLHSYDDLIRIVAESLSHSSADVISSHLRHQFPAALVDEFQDTDQQQYRIFSRIYPKGEQSNALIMIGDPKQAIYGFRGGDVFTYLQAREDADFLWSMDTNWRSTQDMVSAYNFVFSAGNGAPQAHSSESVFDYGIDYLPVLAAQGNQKPPSQLMVREHHYPQALQFICADAYSEGESVTDIDTQRLQIIKWMISEIKVLLARGTVKTCDGEKMLQEKHIAILVRAGFEADLIKQMLQQSGIASVYLSEKSHLFDSQQAHYLYYVLDAIWTGNDQRRCITALATGLFYRVGNSDENLSISGLIADRSHPQWQSVYKQNATYRLMWQKQGIYALVLHLIKEQFNLAESTENAERALTNYQHLAELLAKAAVMHTTQSSQLMWFAKQLNHIEDTETAQLRLESDQALIKIVTQHKSKGLEYPVVFLPFANIGRKSTAVDIIKYHDQDNQLVMQLGADGAALKAMQQETLAEEMRLLYVALTRPIYRCYLGMLISTTADSSAIHRALALPALSPMLDMNPEDSATMNYADVLLANLQQVTEQQEAIVARKASALPSAIENPTPTEKPALQIQTVSRRLQQNWVLTSFTGLTRLMHTKSAEEDATGRLIREPELGATSRQQNILREPASTQESSSKPLRFAMTKGATTGNILHDTLEWLSFCNPDIDSVMSKLMLRHKECADIDEQHYSQWIEACLQAPMCEPSATGNILHLAALEDADTIKETEFYLPIEHLDSRALEKLLSNHRQRIATDFGCTPVTSKKLSTSSLAGMLHGFIDLIFRFEGRYYICDYKSTHLGDEFSDYCADRLAQNIQEHDYDLQYLLYAMALDRFLAASISDYDREKHFGGVYYLYLRGMSTQTEHIAQGRSTGVFYTPIAASELMSLSQMFANTTEALRKDL